MARFIAANPNPWGWNPLVYCGLPTQLMYLPALPYLTAALLWLKPGLEAAYAYRLVIATLACLGPASVYLFLFYFTRSRGWALAGALALTFFSPAYGLIRTIEKDRGLVYLPWRMQVLVKYGEGPHISGLTILPLAVVALWRAAVGQGYPRIFLAAVLMAAVALLNWIAAFSLGITALILLLAVAGARGSGFQFRRVLAVVGLAYLLACFWLTPTLIRTTLLNWPQDSFHYTLHRQQLLSIGGLIVGAILVRLALWKLRLEPCITFCTLGFFVFTWIAVGHYSYAVSTIPEARRYAVEFELFLLLAVIEWMRFAMRSPNRTLRSCAIGSAAVMLLSGSGQLWRYIAQGHDGWRPTPKERSVEFRVAEWLDRQKPRGRVFASGGLRFRLTSWFDVPQIGGAFETGLKNRIPVDFMYRIRTGAGSAPGREAQETVAQLKALGVEYVAVHGPKSSEYYRDIKNPERFEFLFEKVFDDQDDKVFRVPFRSLAHLVRPDELPARPPLQDQLQLLNSYVAAIEDPERPELRVTWRGTGELEIEGPVPAGMVVSLQVTHDGGWSAYQDGKWIPLAPDALGFMVLQPAASPSARVRLRHEGTAEQRTMAGVSGAAWIGALTVLRRNRRRKEPRA